MEKYLRHFGSLKDWIAYSFLPSEDDGPEHTRASYERREHWNGVPNRDEAYKQLKFGNPEGLEEMKRIVAGIHRNITIESPQYEFNNDVEGCAPDIHAFLAGEPENMHKMTEEWKDAPPSYINLQFEMACSSGIQPKQLMYAGSTVFAAMEILKAQGCAVQMTLTHTVGPMGWGRGEARWQSSTPVENNMDLDTVAFLLTHPATLRVLVFSIMEHEHPETRQKFSFQVGGGYGIPTTMKIPQADVMLSIVQLSHMFNAYGTDDENILKGQAMLQKLVDTKFQQFQ